MALQSFSRIPVLLALCALAVGYPAADNGLSQRQDESGVITATAELVGAVNGTLSFQQRSREELVIITGKIGVFQANTRHGFHVHENGDVGNNCISAGGHFNPTNTDHGGPSDPVRHVGDLGNIESDENGEAVVSIQDHIISLRGPLSIIGRTIVIHAGADDFGRGDNVPSKVDGNAGPRIACGLIE